MQENLSVSMITLNAEETIEASLKSVYGWVKEIVIVDSYSTDKTLEIAKKYNAIVYKNKYEGEGSQRNYALTKATTPWVLALDSDEVVTEAAKKEMSETLKRSQFSGYNIRFQCFYGHKELHYGGENMIKMVLFKRDKAYSTPDQIHAFYKTKDNNTSLLVQPINHYSYRSVIQLISKFHSYALREARQKKVKGERTSFQKIVLYPIHMFWARFVKDKGYKDGWFRIPIDLAFAYKELIVYLSMLWI